jgi:hypothetical protein
MDAERHGEGMPTGTVRTAPPQPKTDHALVITYCG